MQRIIEVAAVERSWQREVDGNKDRKARRFYTQHKEQHARPWRVG